MQFYVKKCSTCKETLPVCEFYKSRNMFDGFMNRCIKCMKATKKDSLLDKIRKHENSYPGF